MTTLNPPDTAPMDGTVFLGLFKGYPYLTCTLWNPVSMKWCSTRQDTDMCDGQWNDHSFIYEYEDLKALTGWLPIPTVTEDVANVERF